MYICIYIYIYIYISIYIHTYRVYIYIYIHIGRGRVWAVGQRLRGPFAARVRRRPSSRGGLAGDHSVKGMDFFLSTALPMAILF